MNAISDQDGRPIFVALVSYLALGALIYGLLYRLYADPSAGPTLFKAWFVVALVLHHVLTFAISALSARLAGSRARTVIVEAVFVEAGLAAIALHALATLNTGMGVPFPWGAEGALG